MKRTLIIVVNAESDDKNYKTYKSATQQKFNSINADWFIKKTNNKRNAKK